MGFLSTRSWAITFVLAKASGLRDIACIALFVAAPLPVGEIAILDIYFNIVHVTGNFDCDARLETVWNILGPTYHSAK